METGFSRSRANVAFCPYSKPICHSSGSKEALVAAMKASFVNQEVRPLQGMEPVNQIFSPGEHKLEICKVWDLQVGLTERRSWYL